MVECLRRPAVKPEEQDDVYRAQAGIPDYPDRYLKCSICRVGKGESCVSQSGHIVGGRPDGARTVLDHPHNARKISRRKP